MKLRESSGLRVVPILAALVAGVAEHASAQYALSWQTIDSGGVMQSTGGTYTLGGTIGQADAGALSGDVYMLAGGFWTGGGSTVVGVSEGDAEAAADRPSAFRIHAPAPNPVVRETTVAFEIPETRRVSARVFDVAGRLTRTLVDGTLPAGQHVRVWDATNESGRRVSAGIYFVVLDAGAERARQRVAVVR
ncbi:MAG: FlgD immunoglobulin-like domain containing protein [Candidatus Eiseniibacteriota bacterium]